MAFPSKFYVPWSEIDPTFRDGGIPGELENQFVAADLGDNPSTRNIDILKLFHVVNAVAASISQHPEADTEDYVQKRLLEEMLASLNWILENIVDVTKASNVSQFSWTHSIPPINQFSFQPVRYPVRNAAANEFLHYMLGEMVEVAESARNAAHAGIDFKCCDILIAPLYAIKSKIIKYYFDLEVAGELSKDELNGLMVGKRRAGPVVSIPDDSTERPETSDLIEAMSGVDVIQWSPTPEDWVVFATLREARYSPNRLFQPEGSRDVTEDVAFEQKIGDDGQPIVSSSMAGQP